MTSADHVDRRPSVSTTPAEAALWTDFKEHGSAEARQRLFDLHYPYAKRIAIRHYRARAIGDIEFPDISQLACAGLLEAIDRFKPELGVPFRAYAIRRISGSIRDGVSKMSEVREQITFRNRVRTERTRSLLTEGADSASAHDAMQALVDVAMGLALGFMLEGANPGSTEGPSGASGNAYESLVWKEAVERAFGEVARLPDREQTIIRRHYLDGLDFEQIGALLGVSKGRVSQLHRAALVLLRKRMPGPGLFKLHR